MTHPDQPLNNNDTSQDQEQTPLAPTDKPGRNEIAKSPIKVKKNAIRDFFHNAYMGELTYNRPYHRFINFIKVFIASTRKFLADDCLTKASSIAYTVIVSIIPTLTVALTFYSIFSGVRGEKQKIFAKISLFMLEHNIKLNIDPILNAISDLVENAGKIGGIGAVVMIFSATAMLRSLEKSLNDIWQVKKQRPIMLKIVFYWAVLTLGPLMLIAGTTVARQVAEIVSSPNYRSVYIMPDKQMWVVGNKSRILQTTIGDKKFTTLKINETTVDFDNQNIYRFESSTKEFEPDQDYRLELLEFKSLVFTDIQFIGKRGWITSSSGIFLYTNNHGKRWFIRKLDSFPLNNIHMLNDQDGYIASDNGTILTTKDGGKTWNITEFPNITANFNTITFFQGNGIITGSGGHILMKKANEKEWVPIKIDRALNKNRYININQALFISVNEILLLCDEGIMLKSKNSGKTWQLKKFKETNYYSAYFSNPTRGFIAGNKGRILHTIDGGENWKENKLPTPKINQLKYHDNTLIAIGNTGMIMYSKDEGLTWTGIRGSNPLGFVFNFLAPFAFIWMLFFLIYLSLPNIKVSVKAAGIGAAFTGSVWVIFILAFNIYIKSFAKGQVAIYGALASIPLFLLMIYASSVIILYGAEVAYTIMHPDSYRNLKRSLKFKKDIEIFYGISILTTIFETFESGKGSTVLKDIIRLCNNKEDAVNYFLDIYTKEGILIKRSDDSLIPNNSSENIKISDVINIIHDVSFTIPGGGRSKIKDYFQALFADVNKNMKNIFGSLTLKEVIDKNRAK